MKLLIKLLEKLFRMTCIILLIWLFLSYCEIIIKNQSYNPVYSNHNIIVNFVETFSDEVE